MPLSRLEAGVPGVSRLGLRMAGVELLPLCDWKTSTSLGPVYCTFALLSSMRLLRTISGQAAHIWAAIIRFSSGSPSCLPASRRGGLIGNHLVWLTRICSDQYLAPGPTWWEKTNQVFQASIYNGIQDEIPKHLSFFWSKERTIWICVMFCTWIKS